MLPMPEISTKTEAINVIKSVYDIATREQRYRKALVDILDHLSPETHYRLMKLVSLDTAKVVVEVWDNTTSYAPEGERA